MKQTVHTCDVCEQKGLLTREVYISISEGEGVYRKTYLSRTIDVCGECWAPEVKETKKPFSLVPLFKAIKQRILPEEEGE